MEYASDALGAGRNVYAAAVGPLLDAVDVVDAVDVIDVSAAAAAAGHFVCQFLHLFSLSLSLSLSTSQIFLSTSET